MNPRILNRQGQLPDDGWYQIEAPGEHVNHAAKVVQVIDDKAVASIVNRFLAEAKAGGEDFAGMRVDKDHLSQSMENPTEALGWQMEIRNREGTLEGKIDWTALGLPLIESKPGRPPVYKFFSTEYDPAKPGDVEKIGTRIINRKTYDVVRPLRIDGLSLTNDPNNKGQRPISNRNGNPAGADDENKPTMKILLKKLGLADDASEESAVAALQVIQNRASEVETLTTERNTLLAAQVDADLEKFKNRFKSTDREKWKKQLISNRAGAIELLESIEEPEATVTEDPARITNRQAARTPKEIEQAKTKDQDAGRAAKISNRASELRKNNPSLTRSSAFAKAEAEIDAK